MHFSSEVEITAQQID